MRYMNHRLLLTSLSALIAFTAAAPADAAPYAERLRWKVEPGAGPVRVAVKRTTLAPASEKPAPATRFEFSLPVGFRAHPRVVPNCSQRTLERAPDRCRRARIATGSALIDARPAVPQPFRARVDTYKTGRPRGTVAALVTRIALPTGPVFTPAVIRKAQGRAARRSSLVFVEDLPAASSEGPVARSFSLVFPRRVGRVGGRRRGLLEATRRCPRKRLTFGLETTFADGSRARASDRVRCRR